MAAPNRKRAPQSHRVSMRCPAFDERGPDAQWPLKNTSRMFAGMLGLRDNIPQRSPPTLSMTDPNSADLAYMGNLGRHGVGLVTLSGIEWVVAQFPDGYPPSVIESLPNGRHWDPVMDKAIGFDIECVRTQLNKHLALIDNPRGLAAWRTKLAGGAVDFTVMALRFQTRG